MTSIPDHTIASHSQSAIKSDSNSFRARLLTRTIDRIVPAHILLGDSEQLQQARVIIGFAALHIALAIQAAVYFQWALPLEGAIWATTALAASIGILAFLPAALRHNQTISYAANLVISLAFVSIFVATAFSGGIKAPIVHWFALPPMLAILMGAKRNSWTWAGLGAASVVVLIALDASGIELSDHFYGDLGRGSALWLQRSVDVFSWLIILTAVAFLSDYQKHEQTVQLAQTNRDLRHEVEQRRRAEERTRYLAYYDELTTLPNRQLFKEHLTQAMEAADREGHLVGLLFLDLDGFKEINDTHGHSSGDALLQQVASRLLNCVRGVDSISRQTKDDTEFVSRLGGDEFTILLDGLSDFSEAAIVAHRVLEELNSPFRFHSHEVFVSASIGIALYPSSVTTMDELLRNADLAMYHAKKEGRNNFQFFENSMNDAVVERTTLAQALRRALDREELELHYQPIISAKSGELVAVECLARWNDPVHGMIAPAKFIGIAEQSGLIVDLGEWVIDEACAQFARWSAEGIAPKRIGINVSGQQFREQRLACKLITTVEEAKIDPKSIEIEITETAMMVDEAEASRCLKQLKKFGVSIALDDFGTGYSSLSYIQRFPVDALKIDRSFVQAFEFNPEAHAIATAILSMAKGLNLRVVAEGVETETQAEFLRRESCDELQGYLFSHPLDAEEMTAVLRDGLKPQT